MKGRKCRRVRLCASKCYLGLNHANQHPAVELELHLDFSDYLVDIIGDGFDTVVRAGELGELL